MICLICLQENNQILDRNHDEFAKMLEYLTNMTWTASIPFIICYKCTEDLEFAVSFKRKCFEAEKNHLKILEHGNLDQKHIAQENITVRNTGTKFFCVKCSQNFLDRVSFGIHNSKLHDTRKLIKHRLIKKSSAEKTSSNKNSPNDKSLIIKSTVSEYESSYSDDNMCMSSDQNDENQVNQISDNEIIKETKTVGNKRKLSEAYPYYPEGYERACRICGKPFKSFDTLRNHLRKVHPIVENHACFTCGKKFRNSEILQRHVNRHTDDRKYICNFCGKSFFSQADLHHHMQAHLNKRGYKCSKCDKEFNTASSLRTHSLIVHSDPEDWKFLCTVCGRKCLSKTILTVHMKRHSDTRDFICHLCNSKFVTKAELNKHVNTHSNLRKYKCDKCGADYKSRYVLERHKEKKHEIEAGKGDKQEAGAICERTFIGTKQLVIHDNSQHNKISEDRIVNKRSDQVV